MIKKIFNELLSYEKLLNFVGTNEEIMKFKKYK